MPSNVANSSLLWRFPRHRCPRPGHSNPRQRLRKCCQRFRAARQPLRNARQPLRKHKPSFPSTNLRSQAQTFVPKRKPLFPSANLRASGRLTTPKRLPTHHRLQPQSVLDGLGGLFQNAEGVCGRCVFAARHGTDSWFSARTAASRTPRPSPTNRSGCA